MEVRLGYRQTEAGWIPDQWEVSTVGHEFEVKLGKMLDAERNVGVPKPYLGNKAVQWDRIDISALPTVPLSRADIEKYRLQEGDLLVCEGGEVGRCAIWDAPIDECYYQKALHRLRPLRGFNPQVMAALLRRWSDGGLLANYVTQTSIAHLPREKFMEVPMPVPPAAEQRAIAAALSDMDSLLAGLDRLIAKKRDLKQAAMQQLLTGQIRLPGFQGEWEVKPFADVLSRVNAKAHQIQTIDYQSNGRYPVVDQGKKAIVGFSDKGEQRFFCPRGGVIVFGDHTCIVKFIEFDFLVGADGTQLLVGKDGQCTRFHALQLQYQGVEPTGYNRHFKFLKEREFAAPQVQEQSAIAAVLADMDAELTALEARRDKTRALKLGMMQELLTGRIRLA